METKSLVEGKHVLAPRLWEDRLCWGGSDGGGGVFCSENTMLVVKWKDFYRFIFALCSLCVCVSVAGGTIGREHISPPLPWLPNSYEGGVAFHVFPVLLCLALNPFWKFPRRINEKSQPCSVWEPSLKVESCGEKYKQLFLFFVLLFCLLSPAPYFPFVRLRLSCAAFGDRPGHKCNPFMINEVAIAMTFPLSPPVRWGWGETLQKNKTKKKIHPPTFTAPLFVGLITG